MNKKNNSEIPIRMIPLIPNGDFLRLHLDYVMIEII